MKIPISEKLYIPIKYELLLDKNRHYLELLEYLNNNLFIKQNKLLKKIFNATKPIFKYNKITFKQFKSEYNKTIQENIKKINITWIEKVRIIICREDVKYKCIEKLTHLLHQKENTIYKLIQDPSFFIKHRYADCGSSRKYYPWRGKSYYKKSVYWSQGEIGGIKANNNYRYEVNNTAIKKVAFGLEYYIPKKITIKLLTDAITKHCNRLNTTKQEYWIKLNTIKDRLYPLSIEKYKEIGNKIYQREGSPKFRCKIINGACIGKGYIRYKYSGFYSFIMQRIIGVMIIKKENKAMFQLNSI